MIKDRLGQAVLEQIHTTFKKKITKLQNGNLIALDFTFPANIGVGSLLNYNSAPHLRKQSFSKQLNGAIKR